MIVVPGPRGRKQRSEKQELHDKVFCWPQCSLNVMSVSIAENIMYGAFSSFLVCALHNSNFVLMLSFTFKPA